MPRPRLLLALVVCLITAGCATAPQTPAAETRNSVPREVTTSPPSLPPTCDNAEITLEAPTDGAPDLVLPIGLAWRYDPCEGVPLYTVMLVEANTGRELDVPACRETPVSNCQVDDLSPGQAYVWRVIATTSTTEARSAESAFTVGGTLETAALVTYQKRIILHDAPLNLAPSNGQTDVKPGEPVRWSSYPRLPGVAGYQYEVYLISASGAQLACVTSGNSCAVPTGGAGEHVAWTVHVVNPEGEKLAVSQPWSFQYYADRPAANLTSPAHGTIVAPGTVRLLWTIPAGASDAYSVHVSRDGGAPEMICSPNRGLTACDVRVATSATSVEWWVTTTRPDGGLETTPRWAFTTAPIPEPPQVISALENLPVPVTIRWMPAWTTAPGLIRYHLEYAGSLGTSGSCDTWSTECIIAAAKPGEALTVNIVASDEYSHEVRSSPRVITIEPVVRAVAANYPVHGAAEVLPKGLTLSWRAVQATSDALYKVEVRRSAGEWRTMCTTTDTECKIAEVLANGVDYEWRVTAISQSTGGAAAQSAPATFQTRLPVVLVHGWGSKAAEMEVMSQRLREDGYDTIVVDYMPNGDFEGIPVMAASVQRQISAQLKARGYPESVPIHIIAHSMGGLVSRVLLEHPSAGTASYHGTWDTTSGERIDPRWRANVRSLTTIGTPHQGTGLVARGCLFADFLTLDLPAGVKPWFGQTCADMVPGSAFLERMQPPASSTQTYFAIVGVGSDDCRLLTCVLDQSDGVVPAHSAAALGLGVTVTGTCHTASPLTRIICTESPQLEDDGVYRAIRSALSDVDDLG